MDSNSINNILEKVRTIWVKTPWKKILTFSFFVLLSAIFWFIQVYQQTFFTTYQIPVKYTSVPDSVVFALPLPETINVTVKDNGYGIFRRYFTKRNDSVDINVAEVIGSVPNGILQTADLQLIIKNALLASSTIVNLTPGYISFQYTALKHKRVPVIFDGQILLAPGYLLNGDIQTSPDSVMVYGSQTAINTLYYAYTTNDTISNFSSQSPLPFSINKIEGVKFIPEKVEVQVPTDKYTQKDVHVPVTCINLPENLDVKFFPSIVKISFLVGLSKYQSITEADFSVQFDYNDLKDMREYHVPLRITMSPGHVQNLVLSPEEVDFIFEQK